MVGRRKKLKISSSIEGDTSNLPHDIIQDILSRLPVQSLLRFKCVSKPWYSFISHSKFARIHLLRAQKISDSGTLLLCKFRGPQFNFLKFTNLDFKLERIEFPIKKYRKATVMCSCDGLIVLKNYGKMCVIWNPSTRTYTKFSCYCDFGYLSTRFGLCYDASSDDYKFVLLISENAYVVYSYKNNSWSNEKELPLECILDMEYPNKGPGLFANGALHWVIRTSRKDSDSTNVKEGNPIYECSYDNTYELLCFDPKDDNFKKMFTPMCFDENSVFYLTNLGGQLCLYVKTYDFKWLDIWVMKDYGDFNSWTKLFTIEMPMPYRGFTTPLCLTNKNDVVLYYNNSHIVVYNPEKNMFHEVHIPDGDILERDKSFRGFQARKMVLEPLFCWNNSLVLPNKIMEN